MDIGPPPEEEERGKTGFWRERLKRIISEAEPERIIIAAIVLVGALLIIAAVHSYNSTRLVRKTLVEAQHFEQTANFRSLYLLAMDDAETGQRGYLITGNSAYLVPYVTGITRSRALEKTLLGFFQDRSATREDLLGVFRAAAAKRAELARTIALAEAGNRTGALAIVRNGRGKNLMDQIRSGIRRVREREEIRVFQKRSLLAERLRYEERNLLFGGAAFFAMSGLLWKFFALSMTWKRRSRASLEWETLHDRLTGLPNRKGLLDFLEKELQEALEKGVALGVLFIDLDGFKEVNDRHGHATGDLVLIEVARRFGEVIRQEDLLSRLGGDEFVVCLPGLGSPEKVEELALRLIDSLAPPFFSPVGKGILSCSVGVALFPGDGKTPAEIVAAADMAMYQSKRAGKRRVSFYCPGDRGAMSVLPRSS
ncbi:MAG: diguanylate cyclase domain-containing protein [Leptospirillia bacterium]